MVAEVAGTPAAVALISFTAARLWELRDRHFRQLIRQGLRGHGRGGRARWPATPTRRSIGCHAPGAPLVRKAFGHLATSKGRARSSGRAELERQLGGGPEATAVIERLLQARLIAASPGDAGEVLLEMVHEALLPPGRGWPSGGARTRRGPAFTSSCAPPPASGRSAATPAVCSGAATPWPNTSCGATATTPPHAPGERLRHRQLGRRRPRRPVRRAWPPRWRWRSRPASSLMQWRANAPNERPPARPQRALRDSIFDQGRLSMVQGDTPGALPQAGPGLPDGRGGGRATGCSSRRARAACAPASSILRGHADGGLRRRPIARTASGSPPPASTAPCGSGMRRAASSRQIVRHGFEVQRVVYSPDGRWLALGGAGQPRPFLAGRGREEADVGPLNGNVTWRLFDWRSQLLLVTSAKGEAHVWRVPSGERAVAVPGLTGRVSAAVCARADCFVTADACRGGHPVGQPHLRSRSALPPRIGDHGDLGGRRRGGRGRGERLRRAHPAAGATAPSSPGSRPTRSGFAASRSPPTVRWWRAPAGIIPPSCGMPGPVRSGRRSPAIAPRSAGRSFRPTATSSSPPATTGRFACGAPAAPCWASSASTRNAVYQPGFRADGLGWRRLRSTSWRSSGTSGKRSSSGGWSRRPSTSRGHSRSGRQWGEVALARDGSRIAVAVSRRVRGQPHVRSPSPSRCQARLERPIAQLAWSRDGAQLVSASAEETLLRVWNPAPASSSGWSSWGESRASGIEFAPGGPAGGDRRGGHGAGLGRSGS